MTELTNEQILREVDQVFSGFDYSICDEWATEGAYVGFDPLVAIRHWLPVVREHKDDLMLIALCVGQRGVKWEKIKRKSSERFRQLMDRAAETFQFSHKPPSQLSSIELSPSRAILLAPEYTIKAMKYIKSGVLRDYPWFLRSNVVNGLIPPSNVAFVESAMLASYTLSIRVGVKREDAIKRAYTFVLVGVRSNYISLARRQKFYRELEGEVGPMNLKEKLLELQGQWRSLEGHDEYNIQ